MGRPGGHTHPRQGWVYFIFASFGWRRGVHWAGLGGHRVSATPRNLNWLISGSGIVGVPRSSWLIYEKSKNERHKKQTLPSFTSCLSLNFEACKHVYTTSCWWLVMFMSFSTASHSSSNSKTLAKIDVKILYLPSLGLWRRTWSSTLRELQT